MSEENLAEIETAQATEVTATENIAQTAPETEKQIEKPAVKTFTQEELDAAIGKRLAREQRKWEREKQSAPVVEMPSVDQYESVDAYAEARAQKILEQRELQKERAIILDGYHEKEEEARGKYDDFEQIAYNPRLPITDVMAQTIQASDNGPDVAYYLGSNPKEAERISKLQPFLQAKEIGKIEARLASDPPTKTISKAPAPIEPVKAPSNGNTTYDTTDPRSTKTMTTSEWIAAERLRQIKNMQAQQKYR